MARYRGPIQKIARRFNEPLFGPSKSLERKPNPPGQHGQKRRRRESEYAVQLKEKQKAKHIYGVLERQFKNLFEKAARKKGVTGENLLRFLEARLDNTVFRFGLVQPGGRHGKWSHMGISWSMVRLWIFPPISYAREILSRCDRGVDKIPYLLKM